MGRMVGFLVAQAERRSMGMAKRKKYCVFDFGVIKLKEGGRVVMLKDLRRTKECLKSL